MFRRVGFAVDEVLSRAGPTILDVGCGSGRVGEAVLEAGAAEYVGVDFSVAMLELAETRLARFDSKVRLLHGDFLEVNIDARYEVILALGLFDYTLEPDPIMRRMHDLCSGVMIASFPRFTWLKGPIRKLRYEVVNDCPIFHYTERCLEIMFRGGGFSSPTFLERSRSAFAVRAEC